MSFCNCEVAKGAEVSHATDCPRVKRRVKERKEEPKPQHPTYGTRCYLEDNMTDCTEHRGGGGDCFQEIQEQRDAAIDAILLVTRHGTSSLSDEALDAVKYALDMAGVKDNEQRQPRRQELDHE